MSRPLSIGALSRETGVKVPTIRFYEQIGLLPPAERSASDRRLYGAVSARRLGFIRHARDLGFSVEDIRSLLALADRPSLPCDDAERLARNQLTATETKISRLLALRDELQRMVGRCSGGTVGDCQVIEALADRTVCAGDHGRP